MARVACVDIPLLALQLLLRDEPDWRPHPVAVVHSDRPQGEILAVNAHARTRRILPGMTYAAGRNLAPQLRAAVVTTDRVTTVVGELWALLVRFSPRVEPNDQIAGSFWLDPSGLTGLYGSLEHWAQTMTAELRARSFHATVVVGFQRFRVFALARARGQLRVFDDPRHEAQEAARVPLNRLEFPPKLHDGLAVLGIRTLGAFLRLPGPEVRHRFGDIAAALHRAARDEAWTPLQPRPLEDPIVSRQQIDPPDHDHGRVLFALKGMLHHLFRKLADRGEAMTALRITFELDHADDHTERLEPARPTLDVLTVLDLVRLRLETTRLPAPVEEIVAELEGVRADRTQLTLFRTQLKRNLDAASRALARVRAAFGDRAVTRARLYAAHLPEAGFSWEPIERAQFPQPRVLEAPPPLVRRLLSRPRPLPAPPRTEPERWLTGLGAGAVERLHGPHRVSGGWWVRTVERDYYYLETRTGDLLWIFYDRPRRRWFLHGHVD